MNNTAKTPKAVEKAYTIRVQVNLTVYADSKETAEAIAEDMDYGFYNGDDDMDGYIFGWEVDEK